MSARPPAKRYDRAYFERWYRHPRSRVTSPAQLARTVRLTTGIAEHLLDRPLRSVLDLGCGEGAWYPVLRRLRPRVRYVGVDASAYAVRRFGRARHLRAGRVDRLDQLPDLAPADLVVCADVLHYLPPDELTRAVRDLARLTDGVAFLSVFAAEDEPAGDLRGWYRRPARRYARLFAGAGLVPCGLQCWAGPRLAAELSAMEHVAGGGR